MAADNQLTDIYTKNTPIGLFTLRIQNWIVNMANACAIENALNR